MKTEETQLALLAAGFDPGGIDGDYGPKTTEAMRRFQAKHGLKVTGALDAATLPILFPDPAPPLWLTLAMTDLGIKEIVGPKHNPKVVAMFKAAGFSGVTNDETAWCAAFVGAKLRLAGYPSANSLWALDYLKFGVKLKGPAIGAVAVKKRKNSKGVTIGGHVFFVVGWDETKVWGLGGNQNNSVSVATFKTKEIEGYVWPGRSPVPNVFPATMANIMPGAVAAGVVTEA